MKNDLERILKSLANRRRLMILKFLKEEKTASVADIADAIHLSFKATSRHLIILRAVDLLDREQRNTQMLYRLVTPLHPTTKIVLSLL